MSEQQLGELLEQGTEEGCVAFFQGMPETDRRQLAPYCLKWFKKIRKQWIVETSPNSFGRNPLLPAAEIALFATANYTEINKAPDFLRPSDEFLLAILVDRRPDWTERWALTLLEGENYWSDWSLIRQLIDAGLMKKPDHPNYYLGMISGFAGAGGRFDNKASIEKVLLSSPDLLADDVWRLFEYEGGGENSLANWDRFARGQKWSDTLLALMQDGHLPKERLLACTLEALERDFNHYRAKWFATFYDALAPSPAEQTEHADRLLHLTGASAPNIASWAFQKVRALAKLQVYPAETLQGGLEPVLHARSKGMVKQALQLLKKTGQTSAQLASQAACMATAALGHESTDIQEAALDLISQLGTNDDRQLAEHIAKYSEVVAPSLRSCLAEWGQKTPAASDPAQTEPPADFDSGALEAIDPALRKLYSIDVLADNLAAGKVEFPAAIFDGTDIPRLDPKQRLQPIADIEELLEVCSRVMEDESLVDDAERAFDGLSRLCHLRPDDFDNTIAPVLKRATQQLKKPCVPFIGYGPAHDIGGLVYAWGNGDILQSTQKKGSDSGTFIFEFAGKQSRWSTAYTRKPLGFLSRRSLEIAARIVARQAAPLLSAPTHAGAWIDPLELVRRVNNWQGDDPEFVDICLAMLRLAPDHRQAASEQLKAGPKEWQRAIRFALGAKRVKIGDTAGLWIAAARARSPWDDCLEVEKRFPDYGPDAGLAAVYALNYKPSRDNPTVNIDCIPTRPKTIDASCVTVGFHAQRGTGRRSISELAGRSIGTVRWTASIWPQARESLFAIGVDEFTINLDWWEAMWHNKALLEPLLDAGTPLRKMGRLLLALALAAKEPGEYGLATDIAIQAIEDGRLGSDNLGEILAELLPTGFIKPTRWQKTLSEISRVSAVHALIIQQALQHALQGNLKKLPRDFSKLLDLLKELSIEYQQSITHEPCRQLLTKIPNTGKAGKTAKALLALEEQPDNKAGTSALQQALAQRITTAKTCQAK